MHRRPRLGVKSPEGLVHQHHLRLVHEHASNRNPLLHAARKLMRIVPLKAAETHYPDVLLGELLVGFARHAPDLGAVDDVLVDREPWKERLLLKDDAAIRPRAGDLTAIDQHGT